MARKLLDFLFALKYDFLKKSEFEINDGWKPNTYEIILLMHPDPELFTQIT